ncbi:MAG: HAMP domain-containing protein [Gammaproteobacteria bacterium]|nr:HAMP domain-containing protein [Gammaproteobacteria bacterium]NND37845.1 HAMP domain-containing protein [Gammaproteobacteria bacterium]
MRLTIRYKLFIALLAAIALVIVVALGLTRWSFNRGFIDYVNSFETQRLDDFATKLAGIWEAENGFDQLIEDGGRWRELMDQYTGRAAARGGPRFGDAPPPHRGAPRAGPDTPGNDSSRPDATRDRRGAPPFGPRRMQPIELLDANGDTIFGRPTPRPGSQTRPIVVNGNTVGYLRYVPITTVTELDEEADRNFVAQQRQAIYIIALVALAIAGLLSTWLARQLVAPVRAVAGGARAIAAGRLDERIEVTSKDELGQLATDFNTMAATLEQNRESQRRWVIDIAHELRTPLAILSGELQALEDGVRHWDGDARASLQAEVERLNGLVDDLRELTLSDAGGIDYRRDIVDLRVVVEQALARCAGRIADRSLTVDKDLGAENRDYRVTGDPNRLEQLLVNLLENSGRYTDEGGCIRVQLSDDDGIRIVVEDSSPGVPDDAMPQLFDRLYRVDDSRNRDIGGSGLGLAICRGIVAAHGGAITASPSTLGGLRIEVELPREHA